MPAARSSLPSLPATAEEAVEDSPLPRYSMPVVAAAFAAGLFLGTRGGRHLACGMLRAGLLALKPALVVGGLLKLREYAATPTDSSPIKHHES
ncbi:MAG: hypothetical protein ACKV19_19810 [Verrucomicrobiales bacterium]